jgi:hypothetical protein
MRARASGQARMARARVRRPRQPNRRNIGAGRPDPSAVLRYCAPHNIVICKIDQKGYLSRHRKTSIRQIGFCDYPVVSNADILSKPGNKQRRAAETLSIVYPIFVNFL